MPADTVGLRHWTVAPGRRELAAVRARLEAIGAPVEPADDGVLVARPVGTAVLVVVEA